MIEGLLLIDKPAGISSFGVVAKVRWIITQALRQEHSTSGHCRDTQPNHGQCKCKVKVGHTGTLDPAATGLLVLAIGRYTKKVPELIKHDKTYEVAMCLGQTSNTGDKEGDIVVSSSRVPSLQEIKSVLAMFTGEKMQTPPAFSAVKINGQRAYELARRGKEVIIEPRPVMIYDNELTDYNYPFVRFTSKVGSGTYIRSLVEDIGTELKTGAYMSDLRRTSIDSFTINNAIQFDTVDYDTIECHITAL